MFFGSCKYSQHSRFRGSSKSVGACIVMQGYLSNCILENILAKLLMKYHNFNNFNLTSNDVIYFGAELQLSFEMERNMKHVSK